MKVIIAGSRNFLDYNLLKTKCDDILKDISDIEIVSGVAEGADKLGEMYAKEKGYKLKQFPADWKTYGNSAGIRRNAEMANYGEMLIAFWDGNSRGTKNMIDLATTKNLTINIFKYEN
jgi:hypothetical protein